MQAVAAFLKGMGFTAADLVARPDLVDLIVSYHFVPGILNRSSALVLS